MGNINLKNVSKSFGDLEVIPPLDLKINAGEFVVFGKLVEKNLRDLNEAVNLAKRGGRRGKSRKMDA